MKKDLHPKYQTIKATCSCGNVIEVNSTLASDINVDICSNCHPFYTGQQKIVDTGGRVQRFEKKFGKSADFPNFFSNLCTLPPVSTIFCCPV